MRTRVLSLGRSAVLGSVGVFIVAFLLRLVPVLVHPGLLFLDRYDDGVYYASADALTFGRVPYADFVLLHPPGIALALVPFALLGRLTSDVVGLETARVAFMVVGAINAVLVFHIGRRWGARAGLFAGLLYAVLWPAVYTERSTMLEPLGGTALLVAVLLLTTHNRGRSPWRLVVVGALVGVACCFKLWYAAPGVALVAWATLAWGRQGALGRLGRMVAGGGAAAAAIVVPFAAVARGSMWRMVVVDQLRRTDKSSPRLTRIPVMLSSGRRMWDSVGTLAEVVTILVAVVLVVAAAVCLADRYAALLVAWLAVCMVVLLAVPVFYTHYVHFMCAPAALVGGVGLSKLRREVPVARTSISVVVVVAVLGAGFYAATGNTGPRFPGPELAAAAPSGCIASDSPVVLAMMNRLSSDLSHGCRMPVDLGGLYLDTDGDRPRVYQDDLRSYLQSGPAFVLVIQTFAKESEETHQELESRPVLADVGGYVLRSGDGG